MRTGVSWSCTTTNWTRTTPDGSPSVVDWDELRAAAADVARRAHAPYSGLHVGAAASTDDGDIVTGCNVENASYGLTLCAECGVVSDVYRRGGVRLVALSAQTPDRQTLMPCGRCRQLLMEVAGPRLLIDTPDGPVPLAQLLPSAFGPDELPDR